MPDAEIGGHGQILAVFGGYQLLRDCYTKKRIILAVAKKSAVHIMGQRANDGGG